MRGNMAIRQWRANAVKSRDLIETARSLTEISPRRPSQANLRRAVSTAYYAMFHCLAGCAANLIIGRVRKPAWHQMYRALEHGKARNACEDKRPMAAFPQEVRHFAKTFVILQKARQQADYALDGRYDKLTVLGAIDMAERAIVRFEQADAQHRRTFVAHVLFKRRSGDDHGTIMMRSAR